jgi:hypothetical protein
MSRSTRIVTRSYSKTPEYKEQQMKDILSEFGGRIFYRENKGVGIIFDHVSPKNPNKPIREILPFKLINDRFVVNYCDFHPYGKQKYFKAHYSNNKLILNAIEEYLRSQ